MTNYEELKVKVATMLSPEEVEEFFTEFKAGNIGSQSDGVVEKYCERAVNYKFVSSILPGAFSWEDSKNGRAFWRDICHQVESEELIND